MALEAACAPTATCFSRPTAWAPQSLMMALAIPSKAGLEPTWYSLTWTAVSWTKSSSRSPRTWWRTLTNGAIFSEKYHLVFPGVSTQRPGVAENNGHSEAPILVGDRGEVF